MPLAVSRLLTPQVAPSTRPGPGLDTSPTPSLEGQQVPKERQSNSEWASEHHRPAAGDASVTTSPLPPGLAAQQDRRTPAQGAGGPRPHSRNWPSKGPHLRGSQMKFRPDVTTPPWPQGTQSHSFPFSVTAREYHKLRRFFSNPFNLFLNRHRPPESPISFASFLGVPCFCRHS